MDLLAMLKALGDETRFSMYRELASSTRGMSAQELADSLGLHANTVRLHLERLREAGLVEVEAVHRGTVGRPQHVYSLAPGAPGVGFDPPSHTLLARPPRSRSCVKALTGKMHRLGFDPSSERHSKNTTDIAFLHCPFRELAEAY